MLTFRFDRLPFCNDATLGPPLLHAIARCALEPMLGRSRFAAISVGWVVIDCSWWSSWVFGFSNLL